MLRDARQEKDGFRVCVQASAALALLGIALLCLMIAGMAVPALLQKGDGHALSIVWNPAAGRFGILGMLAGSAALAVCALCLGGPLSFALLCWQLCPDNHGPLSRHSRRLMGGLLHFMTAVPTVVYGFAAVFLLTPFLRGALGGSGFCLAGAALMLALLHSGRGLVRIHGLLRFRFEPPTMAKILRIGIPNGLENSMFQLGKIMVLSIVTGFGTASIAANAVSNNVATFATLPGMAIGFAMLTVVSQCVGAGDFEQVKYYTKKLIRIIYISALAINILVVLAVPFVVSIYGLSEEASSYARQILFYHSACVVTIWPLSFSLPNTLRAAADVKFTMGLSIFSMWVFRIGFSVVLGIYFHMGVFGVWVAMTIDWLFRSICFVTRYIRGKWKHAALV